MTTDVQTAHPGLAHLGPNWFAGVMGTGIVAIAAAGLPHRVPGQQQFAEAVWVLTVALFASLLAATAVHWTRHPEQARAHLAHPVMTHFYGAPAMAFLTVGSGALVVGKNLVGLPTALGIDVVLFAIGTTGGLVTTVLVPYRFSNEHGYAGDAAFGGWLMPVVPPMVSASAGALLVPHTSGVGHTVLAAGCYVMFILSLAISVPVIALVARALVRHGACEAAAVPTTWIVLGPLGQSVTATSLLARALPHDRFAQDVGLAYGFVVLALALGWMVVAASLTLHTAREGMPFSLTWWSFTFPVGTVTTGATALAVRTGAASLGWLATALFLFLLTAWATVLPRTLHGAFSGRLLAPAGR